MLLGQMLVPVLDDAAPRHAPGIGGAVGEQRLPDRGIDAVRADQNVRLGDLAIVEMGFHAGAVLFDGGAAAVEADGVGGQRRGENGLQPRQ